MVALLIVGSLLWIPARHQREELRVRDGFLFVTLFWLVLGLAGALPFAIATSPHLSPADAVFESFSGLTTTGATVITGLDGLPPSILFYRQQLQWLGGMGIIVLAVAIMPMLGVGGMQLYRAETPGPMKDNKLTPRITETAKALWYIYLTLTIACALGYWGAGMSAFDAICHSFSTIAIWRLLDPRPEYRVFRRTNTIELIAVVFMLLAGMNFALHFIAWRSLSLQAYLRDSELKAYLVVLTVVTMVTVAYLYYTNTFVFFDDALHAGLFRPFRSVRPRALPRRHILDWPGFLPVLLFLPALSAAAPVRPAVA